MLRHKGFARLIEIMERLRRDCPWDREQTRESIKPYLLEETYETLEAIEEEKPEKIKEELGDLLFQIIFQCEIAKERGEFTIEDVIDHISNKMVSRHPHVFGEANYRTPEEVLRQWEDRKREEGKQGESILEGIPKELPALMKAHRVQSRAAKVGFDWKNIDEVFEKLEEELREFRSAIQKGDRAEIEDELGDIFFSLVNIARFLKVNPEEALRKTISKFISRFRYIEMKAKEKGRSLSDMTIEEMERLWQEAKGTINF